MKAKLLGESGERTWALVFDIGDPVIANLERFAREQELRGAHFSAIGAFQDVVLRYFAWQAKQYEDIPVAEQEFAPQRLEFSFAPDEWAPSHVCPPRLSSRLS